MIGIGILMNITQVIKERLNSKTKIFIRTLHPLMIFNWLYSAENNKKVSKKNSIKKGLLIRIDAIGDLCLCLPTINSYKTVFPNSKLFLLISKKNAPVIKNNKNVEGIFYYEKYFFQWFHLIKKIKKEKFDIIIDLTTNTERKGSYIAFFSHAKYKVGYTNYFKRIFYNIRLFQTKNDQREHLAKQVFRFLQYFDNSLNELSNYKIIIDKLEKNKVEKKMKDLDIKVDDKIIGIHPGASTIFRTCPPELYINLAKELNKKFPNYYILFLGTRKDNIFNSNEKDFGPKIINAFGKFTLREIIVFISKLKLIICNFSAPLHIASAVGTKSISLNGPSSSKVWGPLLKDSIVIEKELKCIGCENPISCKFDRKCLKNINVMEILPKVIKILGD